MRVQAGLFPIHGPQAQPLMIRVTGGAVLVYENGALLQPQFAAGRPSTVPRLWAIVVAIAVASAKAPEPGVVMIATATWPSGVDITVPARMGTPLHLIM